MLAYLIKRSHRLLLGAALAGVVAGVCSVLLVSQINAALTADGIDERYALLAPFAATALAAVLSHMLSSVLFERLGQQAHADMRRFIASRAVAADFRRLEEIGGARVQSALSEHSANVAMVFATAPVILINAVVVIGCLVYMAWLSWMVFLAALGVLAAGSLGYHLAHLVAIRHLDAAAQEQDLLFGHFRSLIDGAKELRMNRAKRDAFVGVLLERTIEAVQRRRTTGMSIFLISANWATFLVYAFIGLVLFALVGDGPDRGRIMTGFALVFVYLMTPLESLLLSLPRANLARVSAARIDEITGEMAASRDAGEPPAAAAPARSARVVLRGVRHRYFHEGNNDVFALGPVDLTFGPAEIVFLVGGNGSGKTTLAKLLVGLYRPEEGEILLDGAVIDDGNRDLYRQTFSAVFSDFHLFDRLLGVGGGDVDARANHLIAALQLQHKVRVRDGAFTTRDLSQGQRKRLALVEAVLEDRPFLIFDEWAADQDPTFKDVFYRTILPDLKAAGRTVLVISHDDRYFAVADRLIRMDEGRVTAVETAVADAADERGLARGWALIPPAHGVAGAPARHEHHGS